MFLPTYRKSYFSLLPIGSLHLNHTTERFSTQQAKAICNEIVMFLSLYDTVIHHIPYTIQRKSSSATIAKLLASTFNPIKFLLLQRTPKQCTPRHGMFSFDWRHPEWLHPVTPKQCVQLMAFYPQLLCYLFHGAETTFRCYVLKLLL